MHSRDQNRGRHRHDLLAAVNAAAASLQQAAHSEADVVQAFRKQMVNLNLRGGMYLLDGAERALVLRAVSLPDRYSRLVRDIAKRFGLQIEGYRVPLDEVDLYRQVVAGGEVRFVQETQTVLSQVLPAPVQPVAERLIGALGGEPVIYAPLVADGERLGLIAVLHPSLTPDDVPAVTAFANHLAIALQKARLVAALEASEARYRDLYERAPAAHLSVAPAGQIRRCNERAGELTGYPPDALVGRHIRILLPEKPSQDEAWARQVFARLAAGERVTDEEVQLQCAEGETLWVSLTVSGRQNSEGDLVELRLSMVDVTERRDIQAQLREREQYFQALTRNAGEFVTVLNPDGTIRYVSPAMEKVLGYPPEERLGQSGFELLHPDDRTQVQEALATVLQTPEEPLSIEVRGRHRDGSWRVLDVTGSALRNEEGGATGVIVNARDVTERVRAYDRLQAEMARREEAERARERLLAAEREQRLLAETLSQITLALTSSLTYAEVLDEILRQVQRLVPHEATNIMLLEDGHLRMVRWQGYERHGAGAFIDGLEQPLDEFPLDRQAVESGEPVIVSDTRKEPRWVTLDATAWIHASLVVPMRIHDRVLGLLRLDDGSPDAFSQEDAYRLSSLAAAAAVALENAQLYQDLEDALFETVVALSNAMDARDAYTAAHSEEMADWAVTVAEEMGCSDDEIEAIRWAGLLHDIGKIGVPDGTLRKRGPLTEEEQRVMRRHPAIGADIVAPVTRLSDAAPIIRGHHERYDGSGYPDGLASDEIPLGARILAVADAYSAMRDERPYEPARSHEEAVAELQQCAGGQFDPEVVVAFLRVLDESWK